MALAPDIASSTDPHKIDPDTPSVEAPGLQYFVFGLFFIFGGITSLNDVIIPKLKELFTLNYTQAMLVQFCFFTAYLLIGIPGAKLVKRLGYMRGAVAGLVTGAAVVIAWIALGWNAALPGMDQGLYEIVPGFIAAWLAIFLVSKATAGSSDRPLPA